MSADRDLLIAIELASVRSWLALQSENANGWLWRFTSGGSIRANSVATLDYRWTDLDKAIDYCEQLYARCQAPTVFTVSDVSQPHDLDTRLAARGYERGNDHVTMVKPVDPEISLPDGVAVGVQPTLGWMEAYQSGLSSDRRAAAPRLIANLPSAVFIADQSSGLATSSGLTVVDGRFASVQCMATLPSARRHGGAQRVLYAIEAIAAQNDAQHLYLQTDGDNHAAQALYRTRGFRILGRYHTRTRAHP